MGGWLRDAGLQAGFALEQAGVPAGGTTGQVLTKNSSTDFDDSWQTPGGSGVAIQLATAVISSIDLLAGTIVPILAAPGVGKFINVIIVTFQYVFNTTPYTIVADNGCGVEYHGTISTLTGTPCTGFVDQDSNQLFYSAIENGPNPQDQIENLGVDFDTGGSILTLGDGTLKIYIYYTVTDIS